MNLTSRNKLDTPRKSIRRKIVNGKEVEDDRYWTTVNL